MKYVLYVSQIGLLALTFGCSSQAEFKSSSRMRTAHSAAADAAPDAEAAETPAESTQGNPAPDLNVEEAEVANNEGTLSKVPAPVPEPSPAPEPEPEPAAAPAPLPPAPVLPPPEPAPAPAPAPLPPLTLEVSLPSNEIKAGKQALQATATPSRATDSAIVWSVEGALGNDLGTIDSKGLYTSPQSAAAEFSVTIIASLEKDPNVKASKVLKIVPQETLFIGCKRGSTVFPITADVYPIPETTKKLPDFSTITTPKATTVCLDKYNVPLRSFTDGFPEVPDLFEYFTLHTKTKLVISKAGHYKFRLISDDGANLYINGSKVIDNDGTHSARAVDGELNLSAGDQELILDYYQGPRTHIALQLFWMLPGSTEFVIVPTEAFKP